MNKTRTRVLSITSWVLTLVAATVVAGCSKDREKPNAEATAKQFPGYQQVGSSGDAAQLWFDPANVPRRGSSYVIHALKAFPQGYARFDVATNCRDTTQRQTGTQYRADGTAEHDYPGNDNFKQSFLNSANCPRPALRQAWISSFQARRVPFR